ncbi:hypothetical protein [Candidatus Avelusimicrobium gallicola]|uniref:Uncharacterized protein n=1 Tax=Candidatus Avelusimicrobium gallicola TaxID=2562704 RepID=A0A1Y4DI53_9BACT|nr:hypothetical protein [Elusimicrobium sp. An273]OUO57339.1 hypothetical protein B5F75_00765 [Elusimicrobium sp. An273]
MKKKFSWKRFLVLLVLLAVAVGAALPHYLWTVERAKAGGAEAVLINLVSAENLYFLKHNTYTDDWRQLERYLSKIAQEQGAFAPAPEVGEERFFAFSAQDLEAAEDGFSFGIELSQDRASGKIYTVRDTGLFDYMLEDSFPQPAFRCEPDGGWISRWFCRKFTAYVEPLLMRKPAEAQEDKPQGAV